MAKILLIEDDENISEFIIKYAKNENFEIETAANGKTGLAMALASKFDIILLDIMLPGMNGNEICRELRKFSGVPVIFLTSRDEEIDRVLGLEMGADDYITKPFSPRELFARIKSVLRRASGKGPGSENGPAETKAGAENGGQKKNIATKNITIDASRREVKLAGRTVELTYTQFELLKKLAGNAGRVFSRDELYEAIWGDGGDGFSRTVDVHIKHLREALNRALEGYNPIVSIRSVGYKFEEE